MPFRSIGYAAYNKLARSNRGNDGITLVERMTKLRQVEKTVRRPSPDASIATRRQASAAIVADLFDL
ncbi:hypothetical protein ACVWZM_004676 [Bradyrhizobium sp. USDA 4501]